MQFSVGCTGWTYDGWAGSFYPRNLPKSEYLRFYSSVFDTTEINSTFYRIPSPAAAKRWHSQTPPHFRFSAKLPKVMTHEGRLRNISQHMEQFLQSVRHLQSKYTFTVVQLPPSLTFEESRPHLQDLDSYLSTRYVLEGRHKSWFSDDATRYLSDRNICLAWSDVEGVENTLPITSDYVYLRMIGDRSIPDERFGSILKNRDQELCKWAERLSALRDRLSFAVVLANNHYEGFGPATANKMLSLLGLDTPKWGTKDQKTIMDF